MRDRSISGDLPDENQSPSGDQSPNADQCRNRDSGNLSWERVDGATECEYCGRPFVREDLLALHRGLTHGDELTPAERSAFEDAYDEEQHALRLFRLKALGALVLLYFGFLIIYAAV